jgi:hypothetical protein
MRVMTVYRGDTRDLESLHHAGGFVPTYLLDRHRGKFAGFLQCNNKTPGRLGCNCATMGPSQLFDAARQELRKVLNDPGRVQEHVIHHDKGYLSTATTRGDEYAPGHRYSITVMFEFDLPVEEARAALGVAGGKALTKITREFRILMDTDTIGAATLIAALPHKGVELTFLSPILYRFINEITDLDEKK